MDHKKCNEIKVEPVLIGNKLYLKGCDCIPVCNNEKIDLIVCECVPKDADFNTSVIWRDGKLDFVLCDEGGHNIYADQIYSRMVLRCTAATDTTRLAVHNKYKGICGERYPLLHTCHCSAPLKCECEGRGGDFDIEAQGISAE